MSVSISTYHDKGAGGPSLLSWQVLGWMVSLAVLAGCFVYLFTYALNGVMVRWSEPEFSHGWLIPAVSLFVLWSRRKAIWGNRDQGRWAGVAILAAALLVCLLAFLAVAQRVPYLLVAPVLGGIGVAALGWKAMRYAWVPLFFLDFAFPLPGTMYVPLAVSLQSVSSILGTEILRVLGVSVFLDGNIIDLGVYKLQVAEACSGLRYLFPLASFGFLCAWLFKGPIWTRLIILLSTVPITILTNSARIALTGLFIEHGSIALAEGFMHLFEGWVIFTAALAILFVEMWLLARMTGGRSSIVDLLDFDRLSVTHAQPTVAGGSGGGGGGGGTSGAQQRRWPGAVPLPLLACALVMLVVALVKAPFIDRDQVIPERPGLASYPLVLGDWRGQAIPVDDATLKVLGSSDELLAEFDRGGGEPLVNLWVAYYDEQLNNAAIHSPKDCLPGGGWEYASLDAVDAPVRNRNGQSFKLNRGVIQKGTEAMIIYYWLDMRGRQLTNDATVKFYNLWDSFRIGRSDGALVRVMTPVRPNEQLATADQRVADFIKQAYPALQPQIGM